MKYLINGHTGKRFYYNSPATWTIEGKKYNTVARIPTKGHITILHPTKLTPQDFQRLNNKEQNR